MNEVQEEALYDFLENTTDDFGLEEIVAYIKKLEPRRANKLSMEVEAFIRIRNLAFPLGEKRWVSRRGFFGPLTFVISPSRMELVNGILIPGHRCIPFANSNLLPQEYTFLWQGNYIPFTSSEGSPKDFYPFYNILGEEYAPQYVARDNSENEEAYISDPYDDPPEVSIKTLDMRHIYREASFIPGDRFTVNTVDWKTGVFELKKINGNDWNKDDLNEWFMAAEEGFAKSFRLLGPGSCTEEQIAYAYWYGSARMREVPAYSLEDYLYEKTDAIETTTYGIETRFWFAGREIPDLKQLDSGGTRPDKTPAEEILCRIKIPVSDYIIHSYIRDSLFRQENDPSVVLRRLIPNSAEAGARDRKYLYGYIRGIMEEFLKYYNPFTDKTVGPLRTRACELHTAVIDLAARLGKGDIDISWLPRHTFTILSQIQSHTADIMEDLDSEDSPPEGSLSLYENNHGTIQRKIPEAELDALNSSLDSMIETYEDIKELIDEALDGFRHNKLAVIHAGGNSNLVTERLIQINIGGIDIWRRVIVPKSFTLTYLHHIIQKVFGWRYSQDFRFLIEKNPDKDGINGEEEPVSDTIIEALEERDFKEIIYEYGTNWTVRIMLISKYETVGIKPVRCVAGAGAAPPEFINGPVKFRKILTALENGNEIERQNARQVLGFEFTPGEFDLGACNSRLNSLPAIKESGSDR